MDQKKGRFTETLAIMDDKSWILRLTNGCLDKTGQEYVCLPSNVPIRQSWSRFKDAARMVIHWEGKNRRGGAIIEEILDVQPNFDVGDRIIVLTTNPTHEDVVYFSELGLRRILRLRNREKDLLKSSLELDDHLTAPQGRDPRERAWRKLLYAIDTVPSESEETAVTKIEFSLKKLRPDEDTARYLDAYGSMFSLKGEPEAAVKCWKQALDKNPNYYRSYKNLIKFYRKRKENIQALALMQKMQSLNRENISRLVGMGEIHLSLDDKVKAEFFFKSALEKDSCCSGALNGLAEIKFEEGELEESRKLLSKSNLAYKAASSLNKVGIELVKSNEYKEALDHYTKAQYVLPQQDKGPLLFFNIGLCYFRWEKFTMAAEFLKIALIKEPNYRKAQRLLEQSQEKISTIEVKRAG